MDHTIEIAQKYGDVMSSPTGRGIQKNAGIQASQANHLLILHVDTFVPEYVLDRIDQALNDGAVGGCLTMRIQDKGFIFRIYEMAVNFRSKAFGVIDGDLGMFVRRDIFEQLGGFDSLPVMEDLVFSKKMRKAGSIRVLPDTIIVSSRKWHERGFIRTFFDYTLAYFRLLTGRLESKSNYEPQCPSSPVPQRK